MQYIVVKKYKIFGKWWKFVGGWHPASGIRYPATGNRFQQSSGFAGHSWMKDSGGLAQGREKGNRYSVIGVR
jgi:hypothetical protein